MIRKAVIDLGSNSVRIVIFEIGKSGAQRELDNIKQMVRLNEYVDKKGRIREEGVLQTIHVLKQFVKLAELYRVNEIIGVATYVIRAAKNKEEILKRIKKETGLSFRLLSGEDEAYLGYLAVIHTLRVKDALIFDMGGGSTELTLVKRREMVATHSIPYGALTMRRVLKHDPPSEKDVRRALETLYSLFAGIDWVHRLNIPVIGIGGTVRSIAKLVQAEKQYPLRLLHGFQMDSSDITWIFERIRRMRLSERQALEGLSRDRADLVVGGALLIRTLLEVSDGSTLIISDHGLRDGVMFESREKERLVPLPKDPLDTSIESMIEGLDLNREHAHVTWTLLERLLTLLKSYHLLSPKKSDKRLLRAAALLHDAGHIISHHNASDHTFYVLLHAPLFALTHRERLLVAAIAGYKNPRQLALLLYPYQWLLEEEDESWIKTAGLLLRLVRVLDRGQTGDVRSLQLIRDDGKPGERAYPERSEKDSDIQDPADGDDAIGGFEEDASSLPIHGLESPQTVTSYTASGMVPPSYTLVIEVTRSPLIIRDDLEDVVRRLGKRLKIRLNWLIQTIDTHVVSEDEQRTKEDPPNS